MRVLVTGSRNWTDKDIVYRTLEMVWYLWRNGPLQTTPLELIHGGAGGADTLAKEAAESLGYAVLPAFRPRYKEYPKHFAPLARNDEMLDTRPDIVVAFMLGVPEKGGTKYTVDGARSRGLPVFLVNWPGDPDFKG